MKSSLKDIESIIFSWIRGELLEALKNAEEAKRFLKNVPKGLARKQAGSAL
ncbi:hypothetical protein Mtc_2204 [Methanocella conradii HZ254]|uniref:Uncharacterized protein n=1 Tax=Methanocella conradii (strain DSM 24694 / JCM 17849 / CGMCC 1.5162 / HZ254) TaxID=1041930 RepID=H8I9X9_METCZ|nr:hypothetical protein [Methanocella conradii]AFD00939.1 hypothetical protein Mtc_2204 [Methanocella conradii HZ254]MDI6897713.1 hypothetical protein [Methanocella conradii]